MQNSVVNEAINGTSSCLVCIKPVGCMTFQIHLILCMLGNFSCFCCRLLPFLKINFFKKKKKRSGTLSECQTVWIQIRSDVLSVWIQIRTDILSVLVWVQTDCKGYQQTTKVNEELMKL